MIESSRLRRLDPSGELKALGATVVALLVILAGGYWLTQRRPMKAEGASAQKGKPNPNDPVIIEVNGEPIHRSEFEAAIAGLPPQVRQQLDTEHGKKEMADELVSLKLLEQQARRMGLQDDPETRGRIDLMSANFLANAALTKLLQNAGPPKLEELYEKNRHRFEIARVKAIVIPYQGSRAQPRSGEALPVQQARARAEQIVQRLRRGEDFGKIARAESADTMGGELGVVSRGSFPPEIDAAIFSLRIGEISNPMLSPFGFHIFQVTERSARSFDEMKPVLQAEARKFQANEILEGLKKQATIDYKAQFFQRQKAEGRRQNM